MDARLLANNSLSSGWPWPHEARSAVHGQPDRYGVSPCLASGLRSHTDVQHPPRVLALRPCRPLRSTRIWNSTRTQALAMHGAVAVPSGTGFDVSHPGHTRFCTSRPLSVIERKLDFTRTNGGRDEPRNATGIAHANRPTMSSELPQIHQHFSCSATHFSPIVIFKDLVKYPACRLANGRFTHSNSNKASNMIATNPDGWSRCSRGEYQPRLHFQTTHDHAG